MPVDKTTFLTIQYLVNLVTATFGNVKVCLLLAFVSVSAPYTRF
jgi:hypothetical protein